jgi:hypothetical protein
LNQRLIYAVPFRISLAPSVFSFFLSQLIRKWSFHFESQTILPCDHLFVWDISPITLTMRSSILKSAYKPPQYSTLKHESILKISHKSYIIEYRNTQRSRSATTNTPQFIPVLANLE